MSQYTSQKTAFVKKNYRYKSVVHFDKKAVCDSFKFQNVNSYSFKE